MAADLHPRLTPARPDLAAERLRGRVEAARFVTGETRQVVAPLADLWRGSDAARRDTQLLFGERFEVLEEADGLCWGQSAADGYVGHVPAAALGPDGLAPSHRVAVPLAHLYPDPDIKAPPLMALPMGAVLAVTAQGARFHETAGGFVLSRHLVAADHRAPDPVSVAERFLHAPYLWGGRSVMGLDCSGLIQLAAMAAGLPAPRDSDMQEAMGAPLAPDAPLRRGDLVFWAGHVGWMLDAGRLLHANAHHMQVVAEKLAVAVARIAAAGAGGVTHRRRL